MRLAPGTPARRADWGEIDPRATLVDAFSERSRTRVRFPAPPLREFSKATAELPPDGTPALPHQGRAGSINCPGWRFALWRVDPQGRRRLDGREAFVPVEQGDVDTDRHCCDEAVDELADRVSLRTARPMDRCRRFEVDRFRWQQLCAAEAVTQITEVVLIARSGEHFHSHRIAAGKGGFGGQQPANARALGGVGASEELDPR